MIGKKPVGWRSRFAGPHAAVRLGDSAGTREPRRGSADGILNRYFADIRGYPWLTREQEGVLAREAQAGRSESLNRLIECNLPFVVKIAGQYRNLGLPFEDLISEGNLGLIEAARRFDPGRGTRFVTWAIWWIRKSICHALSERAQLVRLPVSQIKKIRVVRATEKALEGKCRREPTQEEMSASLPSNLAGLDPIHCDGIRCDSLDEPNSRDRRKNIAELLKDERLTSVEDQMLSREASDRVSLFYAQLDEQQKAVIACRFGLGGEEPLTLEEIGQRMGRSREGVRLIEAKAMERLRKLFTRLTTRATRRTASWGAKRAVRDQPGRRLQAPPHAAIPTVSANTRRGASKPPKTLPLLPQRIVRMSGPFVPTSK